MTRFFNVHTMHICDTQVHTRASSQRTFPVPELRSGMQQASTLICLSQKMFPCPLHTCYSRQCVEWRNVLTITHEQISNGLEEILDHFLKSRQRERRLEGEGEGEGGREGWRQGGMEAVREREGERGRIQLEGGSMEELEMIPSIHTALWAETPSTAPINHLMVMLWWYLNTYSTPLHTYPASAKLRIKCRSDALLGSCTTHTCTYTHTCNMYLHRLCSRR